jgi:hypothetical protein
LSELGFIKAQGHGVNEYRHVLLLDPIQAAVDLRNNQPELVPDDWWVNFVERMTAVGAPIPNPSKKASASSGRKRKN